MLYHIVGMTNDGIIGNGPTPPWFDPESHGRYFENLTKNHTIIMSKKSYDAFGYLKYLAKKIIVVSRSGVTLEEALCQTQDEYAVFIAGGFDIYRQTIRFIDGIFMDRTFHKYKGDVCYPMIPADMKLQWIKPYEEDPKVSQYYYQRIWDYNS